MKLRELNRTPVTVTELGFGAAVRGNLYRPISDQRRSRRYRAAAVRLCAGDWSQMHLQRRH
jgi:aryl-alcohol dehydrogenase-like predicted oxidoreductase